MFKSAVSCIGKPSDSGVFKSGVCCIGRPGVPCDGVPPSILHGAVRDSSCDGLLGPLAGAADGPRPQDCAPAGDLHGASQPLFKQEHWVRVLAEEGSATFLLLFGVGLVRWWEVYRVRTITSGESALALSTAENVLRGRSARHSSRKNGNGEPRTQRAGLEPARLGKSFLVTLLNRSDIAAHHANDFFMWDSIPIWVCS